MSNPNVPPPAYSDNAPAQKTYGATTSPTSAAEPLLGAQRGMLASGSGQDAWMDSGDDIEAAGDDFKDDRPVDECDQLIRIGFIRRVYRQVKAGYLNKF